MEQPEDKPRPPKVDDPAPRDDVVVTQNRCPFCRDDVRAGAKDWVACAACLARHHEPCWGEGGGKCAACGHDERLRAESPVRRNRRRVVMLLAALSIIGVMAAGFVVTTNVERARASAQVIAARARAEEEAAAAARARADAEAAAAARPLDSDARFSIARRVDELRKLNRSGSRADARRGRRQAAWKQARVDLALAIQGEATQDEAVRLKAAWEQIDRLDPPPRSDDGPIESILEEQDSYLMPPRPEHPEFQAFTAKMRGRPQAPGYTAHLLVVSGDAKAALTEANGGLDQNVTDWLSWLARGEALLALGNKEPPGRAAMAFTLSEAFSAMDPTWALLAHVDLARARGDRKAELAAAYDALEVGSVPEWGGHLQALLERIATLEHELGERR